MKASPFSLFTSRRLTAGYFAVFTTLGVSRSFLGPSLLELSSNTGMQLGAISSLFVVIGLGGLAGNWVGGWLYDHLPGNVVLISAVVSTSLLLVLAPLVSNIILLAALVLLMGFGYGTVEAGGNTLMMWLQGKLAGPYLSGLYVFIGFGSLATPALIGISIARAQTISYAYWALGLLALPAVLLLWRMPSPQSKEEEGNAGSERIDYLLTGFICLLFFLCVGAQASFSGWIYTYALRLNLASELTAAYLTSTYWVAQTVGLMLSIPILARMRPQSVLIADLSAGVLSLVVFLTWHSAAAVWLGTIGLGMSMASLFPASFAYVGQRMAISGKVNGWFLSGASLGAMLLPWVIGQIFTSAGPRSAMLVITFVLGLAYMLLLGFMGLQWRRKVQP